MSYDGGLIVRVQNAELLKIMRKYQKQGVFDDSECISEMIGSKYKRKTLAIDYEYLDCAYIEMCPKNLSEVFDGIIKLLDEYSDELDKNEYNSFKKELMEKKDVIESSYSYVEWVYAHENGEDIVEERFVFENGEERYSI